MTDTTPTRYRVLRFADDEEQDETILRTNDRAAAEHMVFSDKTEHLYAWDDAEGELLTVDTIDRTARLLADRAPLEGLRVVAETDPEPAIRDAARAELSRIAEKKEE